MLGLIGVIVAVLLFLAVPLAVSYELIRRRHLRLAAFVAGQGWQLEPSRPDLARCWDGAPFGAGERRRADDVLTGSHHGRSIVAFEYSYVTRSTDGQGHTTTTNHRYTVCVVAMPAALPTIEASPTTFLSRLGFALGASRVEFESGDFNRRFAVRSHEPRTASAVLHPRSLQLMLDRMGPGPVGDISWRISGEEMICWAEGRLRPAQVLARLDLLSDLLGAVPSFVWQDAIAGARPSVITSPGRAEPFAAESFTDAGSDRSGENN